MIPKKKGTARRRGGSLLGWELGIEAVGSLSGGPVKTCEVSVTMGLGVTLGGRDRAIMLSFVLKPVQRTGMINSGSQLRGKSRGTR